MRVVIAGGHGQIARLLSARLASAGHQPIGLIRNPDHQDDVQAAGAEPRLVDLETITAAELDAQLDGADAVVFAAGAGPGSNADRKLTVDRDGAIQLANAARRTGVTRFVLISAMGADTFDPDSNEIFQVYLRAKSEADAALRGSDLEWTIVRPGALTDDPGTGLVAVAATTGHGSIPRADVAEVVAQCLVDTAALRMQFELIGGSTPIGVALAGLTH
jgi:uncharacterized protein YbjT (DUF2867 family)